MVSNAQRQRNRSEIVLAHTDSSPTNNVDTDLTYIPFRGKKDILNEKHGIGWKVFWMHIEEK